MYRLRQSRSRAHISLSRQMAASMAFKMACMCSAGISLFIFLKKKMSEAFLNDIMKHIDNEAYSDDHINEWLHPKRDADEWWHNIGSDAERIERLDRGERHER